MRNAKGVFGLCVISAALMLGGCGQKGGDAAQGASAGAATQDKVYSVGTDASYAPFEFLNDKKEVQGFDADVLNAVAAKAGIKLKFINTPWEGIFATLQQGDRDVLASAVTITKERKLTMDFSDPYFDARQLIAVGKDATGVHSLNDLKDKKVAVQTGTTGDEVVQKLMGKTSPNIKRFESMPLALKELEDGGVFAAVGDNGVVVNYVKNNPNTKLVTVEDKTNFSPEQYGYAVKKGNKALLDKLNSGLAAIKADGTYDTIYKKYSGDKK
jgi:polar amino acid transport system substrate-binding protein